MKLSFCDFGVLFTALLTVLTVVITAPVDSDMTVEQPLRLIESSSSLLVQR